VDNFDKIVIALGITSEEAVALYKRVNEVVQPRRTAYDILQVVHLSLTDSPSVKPSMEDIVHLFRQQAERERVEHQSDEARVKEAQARRQADEEIRRVEAAKQIRQREYEKVLSQLRLNQQRREEERDAKRREEQLQAELATKVDEQRKAEGREILRRFNVDYLYHMVNTSNLESILQHGLLCHNLAHKRKLVRADISMPEVQELRAERTIKFDDARVIGLHDYVNFYLQPRNPMLYKRKAQQNAIVILAFDPMLLSREYSLVTDGNAANRPTQFYIGLEGLAEVRWDILRAPYWTNYEDGGLIRCAEGLVLEQVESGYLRAVYCFNQEQAAKVAGLLTHRPDIITRLDDTIYFRD
jgi:hypothetical protein